MIPIRFCGRACGVSLSPAQSRTIGACASRGEAGGCGARWGRVLESHRRAIRRASPLANRSASAEGLRPWSPRWRHAAERGLHSLRYASRAKSPRIWCSCMPRISMRLLRLRSPSRILTADFGVFKSSARYSHSAVFARSSRAGACSRTLSAPSITPAISSRLARGWTRTWKMTAPSRE